jgi:hypothetical protein
MPPNRWREDPWSCPSSRPGARNFEQPGSPEIGQRTTSLTRSRTGSIGMALAARWVSAVATSANGKLASAASAAITPSGSRVSPASRGTTSSIVLLPWPRGALAGGRGRPPVGR